MSKERITKPQSIVLGLGVMLSLAASPAAASKGTVKRFCRTEGLSAADTTVAMQEYEKLKVLVAKTEMDITRAEGGNKASGIRVCRQMQDIKQAAQDVRNRVLELRSLASAGNQAGQGQSTMLQGHDPIGNQSATIASPMGWLVPPGNGELSYWKWLAGGRTITLGRRVELDLAPEGEGQMGGGTAVLSFLEFTGGTELSIACWDLVPGGEHLVCTYDAALEMQDIGKFIASDQGTGYTRLRLNGDVTGLHLSVVPIDGSDALTTVARKCYSLSFLALVSETDEQGKRVAGFKTQGQVRMGSLE